MPLVRTWSSLVFSFCFVFRFLPKSGIPGHFSTNISYNLKYKTHPRSRAIGQADIVTDFGTKRPRYTCFFLLCLAFNWFWPIFRPVRAAIRLHCFFLSVCLCPPLVEIILRSYCIDSIRTPYVKIRVCTCIQCPAYAGFTFSSLGCATCFTYVFTVFNINSCCDVCSVILLFSTWYGQSSILLLLLLLWLNRSPVLGTTQSNCK